jgi:hypothetical protein
MATVIKKKTEKKIFPGVSTKPYHLRVLIPENIVE